jgi:hypothetical protein
VSETATEVTCHIGYQDTNKAYLSNDSVLGPAYITRAIEAMERQFMRAGIRLAKLIEVLAITYYSRGSGPSKRGKAGADRPISDELFAAASSDFNPHLVSLTANFKANEERGGSKFARVQNGFGVFEDELSGTDSAASTPRNGDLDSEISWSRSAAGTSASVADDVSEISHPDDSRSESASSASGPGFNISDGLTDISSESAASAIVGSGKPTGKAKRRKI